MKDSHDIVIRGNYAKDDGEYNIVVHGVDSNRLTHNVTVENNHCVRGGQAGQLTAGIVLLFTQDSREQGNVVEGAYGSGIFLNDRESGHGNKVLDNQLTGNGTHQSTGAITLEEASKAEVRHNTTNRQGSGGYAFRLEGGPHTRGVRVVDNVFSPGNGRLMDVAKPALTALIADYNSYYGPPSGHFRLGDKEYSFAAWKLQSKQDEHSRVLDPQDSQFVNAPPGAGR